MEWIPYKICSPTGPFLLSTESRTEGYGDNSSLPYLARHFDLLQVLETDWPRVWDDGNREDSSFLEGMLEEQFKVRQGDASVWIRDVMDVILHIAITKTQWVVQAKCHPQGSAGLGQVW